MPNATTSTQTHRPGKIRSSRAARYSRSLGRRIQLDVIRYPEITKKPSTQTSVSNWVKGPFIRRPVSGQECCMITIEAKMRRQTLSALECGSKTVPSVLARCPSDCDAISECYCHWLMA